MNDTKRRPSASRSLYLIPLAMFIIGLASCHAVSSDEESGSGAPVQAHEVVITADSVAQLAPGQKLSIDPIHDTAYTFDFSAAPIDFSRISMLMQDGHEVAMDKWLNGSEYGKKLLASPNRTFRLGPTKQSMQGLPSLKERNAKLLQKLVENVLVCDVTVTVIDIEVDVFDADGNYLGSVFVEIVEVDVVCYDDGTEP
jgi:hypothetical protein